MLVRLQLLHVQRWRGEEKRSLSRLHPVPCSALPRADFPKVPKGGCVCLRVGGVGLAWRHRLEVSVPVLHYPLDLPASISAGSAKGGFLHEASFGKEVGRCACVTTAARRSSVRVQRLD